MSARDRGPSVCRDPMGDSDRGSSALLSSCCSCGGCCCLSSLCRLPTSWWPFISIPARDGALPMVLVSQAQARTERGDQGSLAGNKSILLLQPSE